MENFKERKLISVKELQRVKSIPLEVAENSHITIGPNEKMFSDALHYVSIKSFEDLQELSIIPQGLSKESILKAISEDDDESLTIAKKDYNFSKQSDCKCHDHVEHSLQTQYRNIRRKGNFQLAKLLTNHYGKQILWDDFEAIHAYKMTMNLLKNPRLGLNVVYFSLDDIIINTNSTLTVNSGTDLIKGRNLVIHTNGKMEIKSSYLFLKCKTAKAYSNKVEGRSTSILTSK
ncbi:hypothetical protein [Pedobacter miscanthi]|uniref:hypothetical protein n=1 Tax=Pedobacter miscanthi TaxID=2259170 RepID=UPI00292EB5FE|nr:hypothetical protein [Pedobacter miscanthi]